MMKIIALVLIILLSSSCGKEDANLEALGLNDGIVGTWVETGFDEDVQLYGRTSDLENEAHGFSIREDGTFIEHAISGWCATPPVVYENYEGTWEALSDSLLNIVVAFYGGSQTYQMRIVFLDGDELGIRYLWTEDRTSAKK